VSAFERSFFERDALEVAPELLNALVVHGQRVARIVEVEAYRGSEDPGSHAFRGPTPRNLTMFGPAGHLYVYFTYGMHFCANVVCSEEGVASAVLLRALDPVAGLEEMRAARPKSTDVKLCAGPARLTQALGIGRSFDGADLLDGGALRLERDEVAPPADPLVGVRIGLSERAGPSISWPWRFGVPGSPALSRPFPHVEGV